MSTEEGTLDVTHRGPRSGISVRVRGYEGPLQPRRVEDLRYQDMVIEGEDLHSITRINQVAGVMYDVLLAETSGFIVRGASTVLTVPFETVICTDAEGAAQILDIDDCHARHWCFDDAVSIALVLPGGRMILAKGSI